MKLSPDEFEDTVDVAREYLQGSSANVVHGHWDAELLAKDFAEVLVKLADVCVVGVPCERHGGAVHGQEAEELRAGVEQILKNTSDVDEDESPDVLRSLRKALIFLLDRIDARDSLAFREVTDSSGVDGTAPPT
jgi:hypothetical protein